MTKAGKADFIVKKQNNFFELTTYRTSNNYAILFREMDGCGLRGQFLCLP